MNVSSCFKSHDYILRVDKKREITWGKGSIMFSVIIQTPWMFYLIELCFKLHCVFRVNINDRSINCLLKALSKPKVVDECLEQKKIRYCNLSHEERLIRKWIMSMVETLVKAALVSTTVRSTGVLQFIVMALSMIVTVTYWGHRSRDKSPTRCSNHNHLRLRLQHTGGHGGGRLLPCEQNTNHDRQDRQTQFRTINARTRTKSLWMQSIEVYWTM